MAESIDTNVASRYPVGRVEPFALMDPVTPVSNEVLAEALRKRSPRFFRASREAAKGHTGPEDTGRFAESLMILQECALLIGEKLEMNSVAHAAYFEADETTAFCFDPNSNPYAPDVAGAIVNRRMPVRALLGAIRNYISS